MHADKSDASIVKYSERAAQMMLTHAVVDFAG